MEIEDTFCEAFDGLYARILITARDEELLRRAALQCTALPLTVLGESEAGVERWVKGHETPDGRVGAIVQIWVMYTKDAKKKLEIEMAKRIRQGVLVTPTTSVFNALDSEDVIDTMERIGHCGDGYEEIVESYDREMISIPIMMGEFRIERRIGCAKGVMGGNVWFMCRDESSALEAGRRALKVVENMEGVITPFDICSAGSKVETKYPEIGPTTNHPYCPTLRGKVPDSKVPDGVGSIPEIVINGMNLDVVKKAIKASIEEASRVDGVLKISAGNYGGKLGKYKIWLRELFPGLASD